MYLLIDLLTLVDVIADVSELRLNLGVGQLQKRSVPQHSRLGLQAQVGERLIVLAAQFTVDFQEALKQVAAAGRGTAGIDLVDHLVQKRVVDVQIAHAEFLGKDLKPETARGLDTSGTVGVNARDNVRRHVPGIAEQRKALRLRFSGHWPTAEGIFP